MAMASARLMPAFVLLPFFNTSTLTGAIRLPVAMFIGGALWPYAKAPFSEFNDGFLLLLLGKELVLGLIIACFLCLPCWVLHAAGSFIDNQRGATLSSMLDPVSGVDSSELANFFNLFAAVIVLQSGGLLLLLQVFERSYQLWEPYQMTLPALPQITGFLSILVGKSIVLASPLIIMFLLSEVLLGLLARYSPQLNAFSLAMTVKSALGFLLLLLYFNPVFLDRVLTLRLLPQAMMQWGLTTF